MNNKYNLVDRRWNGKLILFVEAISTASSQRVVCATQMSDKCDTLIPRGEYVPRHSQRGSSNINTEGSITGQSAALLCKAKKQYMLTWKVSIYCLFALHGSAVVVGEMSGHYAACTLDTASDQSKYLIQCDSYPSLKYQMNDNERMIG